MLCVYGVVPLDKWSSLDDYCVNKVDLYLHSFAAMPILMSFKPYRTEMHYALYLPTCDRCILHPCENECSIHAFRCSSHTMELQCNVTENKRYAHWIRCRCGAVSIERVFVFKFKINAMKRDSDDRPAARSTTNWLFVTLHRCSVSTRNSAIFRFRMPTSRVLQLQRNCWYFCSYDYSALHISFACNARVQSNCICCQYFYQATSKRVDGEWMQFFDASIWKWQQQMHSTRPDVYLYIYRCVPFCQCQCLCVHVHSLI